MAKKKAKKKVKKIKKAKKVKKIKKAKKVKKVKKVKKAKKVKKIKKAKSKRKPSAAFMKPMMPDAALGAVIGNKAMPRTEVTKKIWAYIKRNKLQDNKNRRMINADAKLLVVFRGKKQVSMFELTKLVSNRLS